MTPDSYSLSAARALDSIGLDMREDADFCTNLKKPGGRWQSAIPVSAHCASYKITQINVVHVTLSAK